MPTVVENESYTMRQGAAGSLQVNLKSGDVARACLKIGQDALVSVAGRMEKIAEGIWAPHRDESHGGALRRKRHAREHLDQELASGPTKTGSAYVRAGFPAAFVELGHDIVVGGRRTRREKEHAGKKGKKKKTKGQVVGRTEPVPAMQPALDKGIDMVRAEIEARAL